MKVIVAENREIASQEGAKIIIDQVKNNPETILGLATGTTPIDLYNNMVKDHKENGTDYSKVKSSAIITTSSSINAGFGNDLPSKLANKRRDTSLISAALSLK